MFTIEVKTNKGWNVRNVNLEPGVWTKVPTKEVSSQREVEEELAWLMLSVSDSAQATIGLQTNYRVLNDSKVVFEK